MLDLSQLPEVQAAGWSSLNYAYAINDRGEIIGSGTIGDKSHAFLLSPVTALGRQDSNDMETQGGKYVYLLNY